MGETQANSNTSRYCRHQLSTDWTRYGEDGVNEADEMYENESAYDEYRNVDGDAETTSVEGSSSEASRSNDESQMDLDTGILLTADMRPEGALQDRRTDEEPRHNGARLIGNLDPLAVMLNYTQDLAMYRELQRRGAFAIPGMDAEYRSDNVMSDLEVYEEQRDRSH